MTDTLSGKINKATYYLIVGKVKKGKKLTHGK